MKIYTPAVLLTIAAFLGGVLNRPLVGYVAALSANDFTFDESHAAYL